jgi:hypothetical protein
MSMNHGTGNVGVSDCDSTNRVAAKQQYVTIEALQSISTTLDVMKDHHDLRVKTARALYV